MAQLQAGKVLLGVLGNARMGDALRAGLPRRERAVVTARARARRRDPARRTPRAERASRACAKSTDWACRWIFALARLVLAGVWLLARPALALWLGPGHAESVASDARARYRVRARDVGGPATAVAARRRLAAARDIHFLARS
jgi:hypothetical protein